MLMRKLKAHVAINEPASLAFAPSILYGHTRPFVIYHYNPSSRRYLQIEDTREIKEHASQYKTQTCTFSSPALLP
ncbi:MAG: hypothetical protein NZ560_06570 [Aquificaceae bacterium]|nr:hypothetical protein [Aquificaceae bacterium]